MLRSIFAVATGYLVMAAAVIATDLLVGGAFPATFADPEAVPRGYMVFNLATNALYGILGGYIAARIARRSELAHALALGAFAELLGIAGLVQALGTPRVWYSVALVLTVLPATLLGGWLRARQVARRPAPPVDGAGYARTGAVG